MGSRRRGILAVVAALTGCVGTPGAVATEPVRVPSSAPETSSSADESATPPPVSGEHAATQFWVLLGQRDYAGAVALASYPFDLDGHDGCIGSAAELQQAFADKPLPEDQELVVGSARLLDGQGTGLESMWKERFLGFSGDGAPCLEAAAGDEILYYLVEFTVNGDPVGGLTRVRCNSGDCHVAGVDN